MSMIGIFGGTFDPVHYGHLRPVQEVCDELALDEVHWLPCNIPPHRDLPLASAEHRLAMLRLALNGNGRFVVDTRELERDGPSYMVDTLVSLRQDFAADSLLLILGQDAFNGLPQWHHWQQILQLAHVVVCTRPGSELPLSGPLEKLVADKQIHDSEKLRSTLAGLVYMLPVTRLSISATQIRELCQQKKSPAYLLPGAVNEFIQKNGLYQNR